jgi:small ligand-binding sensory domain FIST
MSGDAMNFRAAHAHHASWREALSSVIAKLGVEPFPAGPGFVYFSEPFAPHAAAIVAVLREATGCRDWVGSVGMGILASGVEYFNQPAMCVLIADWPAQEYRVFSGRSRAPAPGDRTPSGADAAHFAIVHGDPSTPDIAALIGDMSTKLSSGFLVGGLSSAEGATVQVANDVLTGGLSGLVLSSAIGVSTRLTQGCMALPGRYRVTAGEGNIITKIDGRPALQVLREVIGPEANQDLRRAASALLVGLPVAGSDTGDYLVRNLIGIDTRSELIAIADQVEPGMELLFCRRDQVSARADLQRMLDSVLEAMTAPPRGALYFACVARGENMFGERSAELKIIQQRLGDVPLAGFFANGEISHDRLYAYTGVLTVFT